MAKQPKDMTDDELTVDLYKRADRLDHLMAKAELDRRARVLARRNSRYQLAAVIIAAIASAVSQLRRPRALGRYLTELIQHPNRKHDAAGSCS